MGRWEFTSFSVFVRLVKTNNIVNIHFTWPNFKYLLYERAVSNLGLISRLSLRLDLRLPLLPVGFPIIYSTCKVLATVIQSKSETLIPLFTVFEDLTNWPKTYDFRFNSWKDGGKMPSFAIFWKFQKSICKVSKKYLRYPTSICKSIYLQQIEDTFKTVSFIYLQIADKVSS